jgi:dynein heavy chain, axonemal
MYTLLDNNLPGGINDKDEMDARTYLDSKWGNLIDLSEKIGKNLSVKQTEYLRTLKMDVKELVKDISDFRGDYEKNGPMVEGILPKEAIERLKRFEEQYEVREQQFKINKKGEELFGLQCQSYPSLEKTKFELANLKKLYNLYSEVIKEITSFQEMLWSDVNIDKITAMEESAKKYGEQCIKLPKDLKEWQAYKELKSSIENLKLLLPIITILKKESVKDRHW